ncbi:alpha/beta hydrolase [Opitutaceae bacterium TAV5]|nr:alpha/beta hydrolase [Opitutaceae bacterium TAV5]
MKTHHLPSLPPVVLFALAALLASAVPGARADALRLDAFPYPFPVRTYAFENQQQALEMVYMDVRPLRQEKAVVVLLHGKNFSGAYWKDTAEALREDGYRVVMPDQIGFGKSSKPAHYQYTFQQLAANTRALLESIGVTRAHILGHSMGGMLATRYALMFPHDTLSLTLVNPIGLEDWKAKGVPYATVDEWYEGELKQTPETIRAYQLEFYYDGQWQPAYDPGVEMLAHFLRSSDYPRMAWNQALTYDMIFTQPVLYEFPRLRVPTLLIIGQRDRTALGKARAPEEIRPTLGDYPALGRAARDAIPDAQLVELDGLGHLPQIEDFPRFIGPLRTFLDIRTQAAARKPAPPAGPESDQEP